MGRGDFHLLEAQAGLGSEGQETDFRCSSASDLREIISREHRRELLLPSDLLQAQVLFWVNSG